MSKKDPLQMKIFTNGDVIKEVNRFQTKTIDLFLEAIEKVEKSKTFYC